MSGKRKLQGGRVLLVSYVFSDEPISSVWKDSQFRVRRNRILPRVNNVRDGKFQEGIKTEAMLPDPYVNHEFG